MVNLEVAPPEESDFQVPNIFVCGRICMDEEALEKLLGGKIEGRNCEELLKLGGMNGDEDVSGIGMNPIFVIGNFDTHVAEIKREEIIKSIVDLVRPYEGKILPFSQRREDNLFLLYTLRRVARELEIPLTEICITEGIPHIPQVAI
jgi:hypothetical protein